MRTRTSVEVEAEERNIRAEQAADPTIAAASLAALLQTPRSGAPASAALITAALQASSPQPLTDIGVEEARIRMMSSLARSPYSGIARAGCTGSAARVLPHAPGARVRVGGVMSSDPPPLSARLQSLVQQAQARSSACGSCAEQDQQAVAACAISPRMQKLLLAANQRMAAKQGGG